jgi:hypothetical protein
MYSSTHSLTSGPRRFTPKERAPSTHWIGGWVGPRAVLDAVVKRKIPNPFRESNPRTPIVQPVAQHYTDWAVMTLGQLWRSHENLWCLALGREEYKKVRHWSWRPLACSISIPPRLRIRGLIRDASLVQFQKWSNILIVEFYKPMRLVKVKGKFVPLLKKAPRHEDIVGWRYSSTHSLTSALDGDEWSVSRPSLCTYWIESWLGPLQLSGFLV